MNKTIVIFAACSIFVSGFAGCLAGDEESEEDTGFSWPDQVETGCQVSDESGVSCEPHGHCRFQWSVISAYFH